MWLHLHRKSLIYFFLVNGKVINACKELNETNVKSERNKIILAYDLLK